MNLYTILLQGQGGSNIAFLLMMLGIFVVMYFFMIRPQQKKQKDQQKFLENISKGDEVVTIGGLHGKVHAVDEKTVTLQVDKSLKLVFEKSSISMDASSRLTQSNNA